MLSRVALRLNARLLGLLPSLLLSLLLGLLMNGAAHGLEPIAPPGQMALVGLVDLRFEKQVQAPVQTPVQAGAASGVAGGVGGMHIPVGADPSVTGTVTLLPVTANFGSVPLGAASAPQVFTVSNHSSVAVTFEPDLSGKDFSETDTCNVPLQAGADCTVQVTYKPTQAGPRKAALYVVNSTSGVALRSTLAGVGTVANADANPQAGAAGAGLGGWQRWQSWLVPGLAALLSLLALGLAIVIYGGLEKVKKDMGTELRGVTARLAAMRGEVTALQTSGFAAAAEVPARLSREAKRGEPSGRRARRVGAGGAGGADGINGTDGMDRVEGPDRNNTLEKNYTQDTDDRSDAMALKIDPRKPSDFYKENPRKSGASLTTQVADTTMGRTSGTGTLRPSEPTAEPLAMSAMQDLPGTAAAGHLPTEIKSAEPDPEHAAAVPALPAVRQKSGDLLSDYAYARTMDHEGREWFFTAYPCTALSCVNLTDRRADATAQLRFVESSRGLFLAVEQQGETLLLPALDKDFDIARSSLEGAFLYRGVADESAQVLRPGQLRPAGTEWLLEKDGEIGRG